MSISVDIAYKPYPLLAFDVLQPAIEHLDECDRCFTRVVNSTDPNRSVGITVMEWLPGEPDIGHPEPMNSEYTIVLQALTKNSNASEGELQHYALADAIKRLLYRDTDLRDALRVLRVDDELHEHTLKWSVVAQRFADRQIAGEFLFMSATTLSFTTEIAC